MHYISVCNDRLKDENKRQNVRTALKDYRELDTEYVSVGASMGLNPTRSHFCRHVQSW